ncbi:MAG TPA: L-serine ammonia-lyase, iron-sulfur-dependent subunit beta [Spirochaetales bacterium]|nr:L-serine ammonia-lyase, iron-sulfur-dependent subunit beta [Spirochaetales bacterium]HRY56055.1 L-serine ammonia-lyase, iron-sulfur-dependent subunit beta [Spirochaetia bacterium]HRZ64779.1 L-serine ammonia-lyase, iron-sulfur-dependent subunit beta [Spirochaetia bacterium]
MPDRSLGLLDVFGPVMIGPSSSHTAGVARIAFAARSVLAARVERARISFYGSLARTWRGHGSDKAAIAGLLGILPEDERLSFSPELASREGLVYEILPVLESPPGYHPNTVVLELAAGERRLYLRGASVGGGKILIQSIDGFQTALDGSLDAFLVLHRDEVGVIALVASLLARERVNIAQLSSHRRDKGEEALLVVEVDGSAARGMAEAIRGLKGVLDVVLVPSIASGARAGPAPRGEGAGR